MKLQVPNKTTAPKWLSTYNKGGLLTCAGAALQVQ